LPAIIEDPDADRLRISRSAAASASASLRAAFDGSGRPSALAAQRARGRFALVSPLFLVLR
jgi:hypothetical protein